MKKTPRRTLSYSATATRTATLEVVNVDEMLEVSHLAVAMQILEDTIRSREIIIHLAVEVDMVIVMGSVTEVEIISEEEISTNKTVFFMRKRKTCMSPNK